MDLMKINDNIYIYNASFHSQIFGEMFVKTSQKLNYPLGRKE